MGYEDAYRAFEQTRQQAMALSASIAGRVADAAAVDGSVLFARMVIQARSLMLILPPPGQRVKCVDISSCASITRNLVETFLLMHDRWLESVEPGERRFRDLLWSHHQKVEAVKGVNCQRVGQGEAPYDEDAHTRKSRLALQADPTFLLLHEKQRANLLKRPEPCSRGLQKIAVSAGIAAAKFDGDYKLLSALSHPNGFGVRAMDATTLADNEWQVWFAQIIWIAQTYLELGVLGVSEQYLKGK